jgi:hypothetical protein
MKLFQNIALDPGQLFSANIFKSGSIERAIQQSVSHFVYRRPGNRQANKILVNTKLEYSAVIGLTFAECPRADTRTPPLSHSAHISANPEQGMGKVMG